MAAKKKTRTQVEAAIKLIEAAAAEGVLFGRFSPYVAMIVGGVRVYMATKVEKAAAAKATRAMRATGRV